MVLLHPHASTEGVLRCLRNQYRLIENTPAFNLPTVSALFRVLLRTTTIKFSPTYTDLSSTRPERSGFGSSVTRLLRAPEFLLLLLLSTIPAWHGRLETGTQHWIYHTTFISVHSDDRAQRRTQRCRL